VTDSHRSIGAVTTDAPLAATTMKSMETR
jgi:hypothetical protein